MSMSVDTRQLETVVQFASFVEVITDPKKLQETLANVKAVTAEYKNKLGLITIKEEADRYLEKARVTLEEANKYLAKEKESQDAAVKQVLADLTAKKEEVERTLQTLSKRQAEADSNFKESERLKREAGEVFARAYRQATLNEGKQTELSRLEAKLNEKQAKLNQILG